MQDRKYSSWSVFSLGELPCHGASTLLACSRHSLPSAWPCSGLGLGRLGLEPLALSLVLPLPLPLTFALFLAFAFGFAV